MPRPAIDRYRGRWVAQVVSDDGATVLRERLCNGPLEASQVAIDMVARRQVSIWERLGALWSKERWAELGGIGRPAFDRGAS